MLVGPAEKAVCYFEGGDLATLDVAAREQLIEVAARDVAPVALAKKSARLDAVGAT